MSERTDLRSLTSRDPQLSEEDILIASLKGELHISFSFAFILEDISSSVYCSRDQFTSTSHIHLPTAYRLYHLNFTFTLPDS